MAGTGVIDRVAGEAALEPATVERVLELTADSIQQAAVRHEELPTSASINSLWALVMAVDAASREGGLDPASLAALRAIRNLLVHGQEVGKLVEVLMPDDVAVPTPAVVLQARRNAEARSSVLEEFGALRSNEVADLAGSRASNRAALANRWRSENIVVAVPVGDEWLYPGFQFTAEGRPRAVVGRVLDLMRSDPHTTDWQVALWFATPTGWLGGRRPADVLDEDPDAVVEAALREINDVVG
jgi:hypothetical protein